MSDHLPEIPTLDNLRVKSCFICLEEERVPEPNALVRDLAVNKTNAWVHPCPKCALVAHDNCLLRWISSLPLKPRSTRTKDYTIFVLDTFRCPHCRRPYELANPQPSRMHRLAMIYDAIYMIIGELVNIGCTAVGIATLQVIPVSLSLQTRLVVLLGMFIYEIAFLDCYLGPHMFNLLVTNDVKNLLRSLIIVVPTIPFRLAIPGTFPRWIIPLYLAFPLILHGMTGMGALEPLDSLPEVSTTSREFISTWPPSPILVGGLVSIIRPVYNHLFSRFQTWVLGSTPPHRQKRYLSERARSLFGFRPLPPPPPPEANMDVDPAPIVIADQIIVKDQSSFTHDVLHAVCSLAIPRLCGSLLHAASAHSSYMRHVLGVRPSVAISSGVPSYYGHPNWAAMSLRHRALAVSKTVGGLLVGRAWVWAEVDPVWWRNSLGYGIFVLAKDCFELYRLWLQKKEVQSRTIRSRDFAGVDLAELDLIAPERFL